MCNATVVIDGKLFCIWDTKYECTSAYNGMTSCGCGSCSRFSDFAKECANVKGEEMGLVQIRTAEGTNKQVLRVRDTVVIEKDGKNYCAFKPTIECTDVGKKCSWCEVYQNAWRRTIAAYSCLRRVKKIIGGDSIEVWLQ
jgi:hypothetical protein